MQQGEKINIHTATLSTPSCAVWGLILGDDVKLALCYCLNSVPIIL